jgi:hypothetical protein
MIRRIHSLGTLVEETRHKLYEKEKTRSKSIKRTILRMAFKGTEKMFAVKEYSHKKFQS